MSVMNWVLFSCEKVYNRYLICKLYQSACFSMSAVLPYLNNYNTSRVSSLNSLLLCDVYICSLNLLTTISYTSLMINALFGAHFFPSAQNRPKNSPSFYNFPVAYFMYPSICCDSLHSANRYYDSRPYSFAITGK